MVWEKIHTIGGTIGPEMNTKKFSLDIHILNKKVKIHFQSGKGKLNVSKRTGQLNVTYGEDGFFAIPISYWSPSDKLIQSISVDNQENAFRFLFVDNDKTQYTIYFDKKEDFNKLVKIFNFWAICINT
jgi:hypothetical protein